MSSTEGEAYQGFPLSAKGKCLRIVIWKWAIASAAAVVVGVLLGSIRGLDLQLAPVGLKAFPVVLLGDWIGITEQTYTTGAEN